VTEEEVDGTEDEEKPYRVRNRKSVSYREVPVEELEDEGEDDEDEDEDEEKEGMSSTYSSVKLD
jgi:hypothetical protein